MAWAGKRQLLLPYLIIDSVSGMMAFVSVKQIYFCVVQTTSFSAIPATPLQGLRGSTYHRVY